MMDGTAATLALRNRAISLTVATTGSVSLSATATGYHRLTGSFVTDGFVIGQEILVAGFAVNGYRVLTGVTASDLTTDAAQTVEVSAAGRTISVGLPALRAFENLDFTPTTGRPYVEEDFVPGSATLQGQRNGGYVYEEGLYILKWYGLSNRGVGSIRKGVDALKLLFAPGTALVAGANTLRVRGDTSTYAGQLIPMTNGWTCCVLTIPWRVESVNAIAA